MAEHKNCYLICYDIRNSNRWRKAYNLLQGYGDRIQYSIFRCWLTMRTREKLRWELEIILTSEDELLLIRLSHQCISDIHKYNRSGAWFDAESYYKIL
ncbi:CRISPR-associated endonuclease Cas2 [Cylindrospermopsis curvispora]|uniref:CRISPR-associated endoribonuclease Cas2 n=1 Tax=Cylindrospermopsis curvispora GIHE-G1 TaxID=2666332 RepID=A0A7H0F5Q5_9CYAN|nr:CRISPR-associated endonuclease Cas2 [Cylindrospermopsis curvispora]QNP31371.1 CRISPR-associated endonuclease Cas2 [Cylindrospermopsis curvispora GIHE-G1]